MATLKIMYKDYIEWITDVKSVITGEFVSMPRHCKKGSSCTDCAEYHNNIDVLSLFQEPKDQGYNGTWHVGSYEHHDNAETHLHLLHVERAGSGVESWVAPVYGSFLMSDAGTTIDRL